MKFTESIGNKCDWCCGENKGRPPTFCWTRMQAESGQALDTIIHRKELERKATDGIFYWGIGNSLGASIDLLLKTCDMPEVLFSIMHSKAKLIDSQPDEILLWRAYLNASGDEVKLPDTVAILSRASTPSKRKTRHYALVCESEQPLKIGRHGVVNFSHLYNFGGKQSKLGYSQVTANVRHRKSDEGGSLYDVNMKALLRAPYCIRLCQPKTLTAMQVKDIKRFSMPDTHYEEWASYAKHLNHIFDKN